MKTNPNLPNIWFSKDLKISKSLQDPNMFLVTILATNQWYSVHTSHEAMYATHKPGVQPTKILRAPMSIYSRHGSHVKPKLRKQA